MAELPRPLAVVAEAAGAANIILAWLARHPGEIRPYFTGPALAAWKRAFPSEPLLPSVESALSGAAALLSGTGWSEVERNARSLARDRGTRSVAVVDHWVNYRERFVQDGAFVAPDELWVTDDHALGIARRELPEIPATLQPNHYLEEQRQRIINSTRPQQGILYVLEPIGADWGRGEAGEFQALDYFLGHMDALGLPPDTPIRLRPHPTDPAGKYTAWLQDHTDRNVEMDPAGDLAEAIAGAEVVAGCHTFALVIALDAGVKAVSTLPPWAPPCVLPHQGLVHLRKIASVPR
jgi:hypothetical protein